MRIHEAQLALRITGRVQGVGYRYAARDKARALGLKGWVRNRPDGSVEAVVEGPPADCNAFVRWCKEGPGYSWVERVDVSESRENGLKPFEIRS
ncbi:MAG: acylphosphatase [Bacteroidales bacterium]